MWLHLSHQSHYRGAPEAALRLFPKPGACNKAVWIHLAIPSFPHHSSWKSRRQRHLELLPCHVLHKNTSQSQPQMGSRHYFCPRLLTQLCSLGIALIQNVQCTFPTTSTIKLTKPHPKFVQVRTKKTSFSWHELQCGGKVLFSTKY